MPKNPETLTVDALDAESARLKGEIEALRDKRRALKEIRDRKVSLAGLGRKLNIDVDGLTKEQADALLEIARSTPPTPGSVDLTPEPAVLDAEPATPEVN